ncbi:MAG: signal recognition particle protein Srp54 [Holosporales bacterium]|jgi:signal recognition particle subunit SRP54|nr:signal recognition particle protein Srp54 [Holosporales bacterium]
MFNFLSQKLNQALDRLRGKGFLNENDVDLTLREIRIALIESDVALPAVKALLESIKAKAVGHEIIKSVTPGQMVIKLVRDEIVAFLGESTPLNMQANSPFSYLFVGLQGAGKTTSVAKIANFLKDSKNVLTVSLDVYRPAAQKQLEVLSEGIGVPSLPIVQGESPMEIASRALSFAKKNNIDVILFDTAGRLHIDDAMMQEVSDLHKFLAPVESLLIADAMMGQESVNVAKSFNDLIPLTGLVLTRADGDAKGGAILSMQFITGCPVKFLGTGEQIGKLIPFDPMRVASQILGYGDVLQLVDAAELASEKSTIETIQKRLEKGLFTMDDMRRQLEVIQKIDVSGIVSKFSKGAAKSDHHLMMRRYLAFINSMTPAERNSPAILNASRRRRIATGAGQTVAELNQFLKTFDMLRGFIKKFGGTKGKDMLKALGRFQA